MHTGEVPDPKNRSANKGILIELDYLKNKSMRSTLIFKVCVPGQFINVDVYRYAC